MKHPHAELMKAYADDCTIKIQIKEHWGWVDTLSPSFHKNVECRSKPSEVKMIRVGRHEWQEPLKEVPIKSDVWTFDNCGVQYLCSKAGIEKVIAEGVAHRTKEAAEQHRNALRCINRGDIE
jgi:hypothetical protein